MNGNNCYFQTTDGRIIPLSELVITETRDSLYSNVQISIIAKSDAAEIERLHNAFDGVYPEGTIYVSIPESFGDTIVLQDCAVTAFYGNTIEFYARNYVILKRKTEMQEISQSRLFYILREKAKILSEEQNK